MIPIAHIDNTTDLPGLVQEVLKNGGSLVLCVCFVDRCLSFLAIVSSVLLRLTMMATQLYVRVRIVLTGGEHWHRKPVH
jgi:hypothetical protein